MSKLHNDQDAGVGETPGADPSHPTIHAAHRVAPEDRVPTGQKCAYAMGVVSDHYAQFSIHAFLFPFFNVAFGVMPSVIGWAMGLARLWDAFNDPIIGNISDNWRGRLGRRRPFLFAGALLTGLLFPLIWLMPNDWAGQSPAMILHIPLLGENWEVMPFEITWPLIWLSVALVLYYTAYSLLSVPYESLGMELTPDFLERTNLFAFRTYIMKFFDFINQWLLPLAMWAAAGLATSELLAELPDLIGAGVLDPSADKKVYQSTLDKLITDRTAAKLLEVVPWVAVGVGVAIILSGVLPAIFCRERYQDVAQKQRRENPVKSLWELTGNLPFWIVTGAIAIYLLGVTTNATLSFYVHSYYVCEGSLTQGATLSGLHGTVGLVFGIIGAIIIQILTNQVDTHALTVPHLFAGRFRFMATPVLWMLRTRPVAWVFATHIDKKPLLIGCLITMALSTAAWAVTYMPGGFYLTLATRPFIAVAETGFWVLMISMRADVADWDEYRTGQRREGVIAALGNWQVKLAITVAAVAGAYLLQSWVKFDANLGMDQAEGTLPRLKWTYVVLQTATNVVVLSTIFIYPLTRAKLDYVRQQLEQRRSAV